MNLPCDPVKPCTTLGHIYTDVLLVRCPHRESFVLYIKTWRDTDMDEPELLFQAERAFGPFDDASYIDDEVRRISADAFEALRGIGSL